MGYVYKIANTRNNKSFIGQTFHLTGKRWRAHKTGKGTKAVYRAIQMYSPRNPIPQTRTPRIRPL